MNTPHRPVPLSPRRRLALVIALCILTCAVSVQAGQHDYFESLVSRPDFWKGFSLRPRTGEPKTSPYYENQFGRPKDGGYQGSNNSKIYVTHDAIAEAAKVVIPGWFNGPDEDRTLKVGLNATETHVIPNVFATYNAGKVIKLDNEVMLITAVDEQDPATDTREGFTVLRGQFGTTAAPHIAGTPLYTNTNSLPHQLILPLGTEDGNTYLFTWDALYSQSYMKTELQGNKTFQFCAPGTSIWLEVKTNMQGGNSESTPPGFDPNIHVAGIGFRVYNSLGGDANWLLTDGNHLGPGPTSNNGLLPMTGKFLIFPDRWVRYWIRIKQKANDYDRFDLWMADSVQPPIQIFSDIPASVRTPENRIDKFRLEFNDSQSRLAEGRAPEFKDMVAYVRNFAILRNPPADISSLLQRPATGGVPPSPVPAAPTIVAHPANRSVTAGTNALFSVIYTGYPMPTFQWESKSPTASGFTQIFGAKGPTYTFASAQIIHTNTQFRCVVTNNLGSVTSNAATLTVSPAGTTPPPPTGGTTPPPPPPPPPSGGELMTPTLSLPTFLPINSAITAGYTGSTPPAYFSWTFTPITSSPAASGGGRTLTAGAPSPASFNTPTPIASLATQGLELGTYQVTVRAHDSAGTASAAASAQVTLVSANLDLVQVYPNPWRSDRHATRSVSFGNLTVNTEIKIFTTSGHHVKTLPMSSSRAEWDLTNESGDKVASGIYMYVLKADDGSKKTGKVVIIK